MEKYQYKEVNGETVGELNPEWAQEAQAKKFQYFLKHSNIPKDYWDLDFDDYTSDKNKAAVKQCRTYAERCRKEELHNVSLYLHGPQTSGKTTIACAIGKEFIRQGYKVQFVLAGEFINLMMKNQGFNNDPLVIQRLRFLLSSDLLIIDDAFDKDKALMWSNSESKNLIIAEWDTTLRRYLSNDGRVIFTSNFMLEQISSVYGRSMYELVDRNFIQIRFEETTYVKVDRKKRLEDALK